MGPRQGARLLAAAPMLGAMRNRLPLLLTLPIALLLAACCCEDEPPPVCCEDESCEPESFCGNGIVEGDEQCDDGNPIDGDFCRNDCTLPTWDPGCEAVQPGAPYVCEGVCGVEFDAYLCPPSIGPNCSQMGACSDGRLLFCCPSSI